jgi:hypothetical protein
MVYAGFVAPFAEEKRRTPVKERASERTCGVKVSEREMFGGESAVHQRCNSVRKRNRAWQRFAWPSDWWPSD